MSRVMLLAVPSLAEQDALLLAHPCQQCERVYLLDVDDDGLRGATCDCGASAGANERWDLVTLAGQLGLCTEVRS